MVIDRQVAVPENNPPVEFNIVHTTGISEEVLHWLIDTFGHTDKGRWFIVNRSIYFKNERDWMWFELRWS
jgi:hypothetical protein